MTAESSRPRVTAWSTAEKVQVASLPRKRGRSMRLWLNVMARSHRLHVHQRAAATWQPQDRHPGGLSAMSLDEGWKGASSDAGIQQTTEQNEEQPVFLKTGSACLGVTAYNLCFLGQCPGLLGSGGYDSATFDPPGRTANFQERPRPHRQEQ